MASDLNQYKDSFSKEAFEHWEHKDYRTEQGLEVSQLSVPGVLGSGNGPGLDLPIDKIRAWASTQTPAKPSERAAKPDKLYRPLLNDFEIRVLEIQPGSYDDDLQCSLHHCSLEFAVADRLDHVFTPYNEPHYDRSYGVFLEDLHTPVRYTALSYTWGAPVFDATIRCDGYEMKITSGLAVALRHFRKKDHSVVMWIDQICIDQGDGAEKSTQIPLMTNIYELARNTVIWIGEGDSDSDLAMEFIGQVGPLLQWADDINPDNFNDHQLPGKDDKEWKVLIQLLKRNWFSRLWIIQEVTLSKLAYVVCGKKAISWAKFDLGCSRLVATGISRWLQTVKTTNPDDQGGKTRRNSRAAEDQPAQDVCQRAVDTRVENNRSIFNHLISTRTAQAWDKRDKVYGLLGVCNDEDRAAVNVNYHGDFTWAHLFHAVAVYALQKPVSRVPFSKLLACVDHDAAASLEYDRTALAQYDRDAATKVDRDVSKDLPSWVPDWRLPRVSAPLKDESFMFGLYSLSGVWPAECQSRFAVDPSNPKRLRGPGVLVDTIAQLSNVFHDPDLFYQSDSPGQPLRNPTLLAAREFACHLEQHSAYPQDQIFHVFWRTLVAGQDASGREQAPESFAEIVSLLLDTETGVSPSLPGQTYSARQLQAHEARRLKPADLGRRKVGESFQELRKVMRRVLRKRFLGISEKGYLGLFPRQCRKGDAIYGLDLAQTDKATDNPYSVPFVIRAVHGRDQEFQVVGECYLHGIMFSEAVSPPLSGVEEIYLV